MAKIYKLLAQSSYLILNRMVARKLKSNDAALLLAELAAIHDQHPENEFVFRKQDVLMESCNLTLYSLRNCVKLLKEKEILEIRRYGTPPMNWYRVNEQKMYDLLISDSDSYEDQQVKEMNTASNTSDSDSYKDPNSIAYINNKSINNELNSIEENNNIYNNTNISELQREKNKAFRVDIDMNYINETLDSI